MVTCPATIDFFRERIDHMINLCASLPALAFRMPWGEDGVEELMAKIINVVTDLAKDEQKTGGKQLSSQSFLDKRTNNS